MEFTENIIGIQVKGFGANQIMAKHNNGLHKRKDNATSFYALLDSFDE